MIPTYAKDSAEKLDYSIEWADWLTGADTISTVTWTVPAGLTQHASSNDNTRATTWLSGGIAGTTYNVECRITTAEGRIAERALVLAVVARR